MSEPEPLSESVDKVTEAAMVKAKQWGLIRPDGQVTCIRDSVRHCNGIGTMPTLYCEPCLSLHRRGIR